MSLGFDPDQLAGESFSDDAWVSVLSAVDRAYAELIDYQEQLERQNEELLEFRRFLSSILRSVSDIMIVIDRENRIQQVSKSLASATGRTAASLTGSDVRSLFDEQGAEMIDRALSELRLWRETTRFEASIRSAEGAMPFDLSISARLGDHGRPTGAVVVGRPLGDLRKAYAELEESHRQLKDAQGQLVRNEKLASLGRLLAGVAHELNNPISFVYANVHALERYIGRFETYFERVEAGAARDELVELRKELKLDRELKNLREAIVGAREGSERVRDIVEDLRRLSAGGSGQAEEFDIVEVAKTAVRWVDRGSKAGIPIVLAGEGRLMVRGDPGHIQQIVMNLTQNAIDALAGQTGPQIEIAAIQEAGTAILAVKDNGPGIPPECVASVFDPFFTTKPVGQGTGLGLAISHKIAEEHGGRLLLVENGEPGAEFRLELPMRAPP
ncbi:MAG: ATP-binding protein [Paracoccaceae bacterium]|nr:ATP-binding protein [Paracoccaceae bacterium]